MNSKHVFALLVIASFIDTAAVINSPGFGTCQIMPSVLIVVFMHCFLHCFSLYGFLFDDLRLLELYLALPCIIGVLWLIQAKESSTTGFKNACLVINETDLLCGIAKEGATTGFTDIYRTLGIPDIPRLGTNWAFAVITASGFAIAIYKIHKFIRG